MGKGRGGKRRVRTRKRRFPAKLPPREPDGDLEVRYYETQAQATAARKQAWSAHRGSARRQSAEFIARLSPRAYRVNREEQRFLDWLGNHRPNALVLRNGWPDFLIESRGQIVGVEVKSSSDALSADQIRCMRLLTEAGIPCFVWRRDRIVPYHEDLMEWPGDASRCSSGQGSPQKLGIGGSKATTEHATLASDDTTDELDPTSAETSGEVHPPTIQ